MKNETTLYQNTEPFFVGAYQTDTCHVDIHLHSAYEIFMATTGNIRYHIEGRTYDLQKGDLIITNNSEIHRPTVTDHKAYGRKFILFNPNTFLSYIHNQYPLFDAFTQRKKGHANHLCPLKKDQIEVEALFDKLYLITPEKDPKSKLISYVYALELFLKIDTIYKYSYVNTLDHGEEGTIDSRIQKILDDLNANYCSTFDLEALAKTHFLDKYYMSHLFKNETGFTIMEYIQSRRMMYAKTLIAFGTYSFEEISVKCGYNDYSNFYKTFKKLIRMSPRDYAHRHTTSHGRPLHDSDIKPL